MSALNTELKAQVGDAIARSPHISGRTLRFETADGHVTLRGTVSSYFEKQMAQEAIRRIEGVEGINNDLEVSW